MFKPVYLIVIIVIGGTAIALAVLFQQGLLTQTGTGVSLKPTDKITISPAKPGQPEIAQSADEVAGRIMNSIAKKENKSWILPYDMEIQGQFRQDNNTYELAISKESGNQSFPAEQFNFARNIVKALLEKQAGTLKMPADIKLNRQISERISDPIFENLIRESNFNDKYLKENPQVYPNSWFCTSDNCGMCGLGSCGRFCIGGGDGSCFLPQTGITLANGNTVDIENIKIGDEVLSFDIENQRRSSSKVSDLIRSEEDMYYLINNDIKVTSEHRFMANGEWTRVADLKIGDQLETVGQQKESVQSLRQEYGPTSVYSLVLDGPDHNYFANGVLVHNRKFYFTIKFWIDWGNWDF